MTANTFVPYVTHNDYREITVRGVVLSIVLAVVLGAANVYLGLLVGLTVSASIPASVMSMAALKCFKDSNILENNIVQTAASAGEALAAAAIFTLPGLVIMNTERDLGNPTFAGVEGWDSFLGVNYAYVTFLTLFGGLLGIAYSIPLRRALLMEIEPPLKFPEGVATAQVLRSGEKGGNAVYAVGAGTALGTLTKLFETLGMYSPTLGVGWLYKNMYPSYIGLNVSSALFGVGYIVGPNVGTVLFLGSMCQYLIMIPISAVINDRWSEAEWDTSSNGEFNGANVASAEFGEARYAGIGLMVVGGLWSLVSLRSALITSVKFGIRQLRGTQNEANQVESSTNLPARLDQDFPFKITLLIIGGTIVPLYIIFSAFSDSWGRCLLMAVVVAILSFLFASVAAYMAGLVGSSNNPVSGVTISSSLVISALILGLWGSDDPIGPPTAVIMCCAVASACAISGDNMQDLKAGYLLGATPWKQEFAMILGVFVTSVVIAPILELLDSAYTLGIGLEAPQASIIATIPVGIINGTLPWAYIGVGAGLGVVIIALDKTLERFNINFRLPVLAFAVAFYLPCTYLVPIFMGSMLHLIARTSPDDNASEGVLYCAGLVAGDSLFGIISAIPIVASSNGDIMRVVDYEKSWPALLPLLAILASITLVAKFSPFTGGSKKGMNTGADPAEASAETVVQKNETVNPEENSRDEISQI
ncbi:Divergent AAA domain protein [Hondaea fermentalgiana]|uniref:Divergent AAA domain protein n=1 Tax=Hondaea fermentalgiana TaxID=2315210 RepID=A0A2R5GPR5_9STRA|nr:Divergent AAA domain protein [Hondaea fermentalgiana]|eukprot:GBG31768.1 Divergent AAA domain protein [Hondaea fermentalgiana]